MIHIKSEDKIFYDDIYKNFRTPHYKKMLHYLLYDRDVAPTNLLDTNMLQLFSFFYQRKLSLYMCMYVYIIYNIYRSCTQTT